MAVRRNFRLFRFFSSQKPSGTQATTDFKGEKPMVHSAHHLTLTEARDLLDWLETQRIPSDNVTFDDDGFMSVQWVA